MNAGNLGKVEAQGDWAGGEKKFSSAEKLQNNVHHVHHVHPPEISLDDSIDANKEQAASDCGIIENAIATCKDNPRALFSEEFTEAVRRIRTEDNESWIDYRVQIKAAKPSGVLLSDIDKLTAPSSDYGTEDSSTASELIGLVQGKGELFFDPDSDRAFFHGDIKGVKTTLAIGSRSFIDWISYEYFSETKAKSKQGRGSSAPEAAIKQACFSLSGLAKHDNEPQKVWLRAADIAGGHCIALGDESLRVITATASGWRVLDKSPVKFWCPANTKPLPIPRTDGDYSRLWDYVNAQGDDQLLILAWILECYRVGTPNPVLLLTGGQGCAKSSSQNRLRELIDNNAVNLRGAPKTVEDIFVSSKSNWLLSFENMSNLSPQMQDALCVVATGGGFSARTLYTNDDETVIKTKRPVIINGISNVITAQDLTDRSVQVELQRLDYIEESIINAKWEIDAPFIFGGILDLFVKTLAELPTVKLDKPPRMADFTRLGEAMCKAIGKPDGYFTDIFITNRKESISKAMEASPAALAIREMVEEHNALGAVVFAGTIKALLDRIEKYKTDAGAWPRSARGLGDILRRQQPALTTLGISIEISKPKKDGVHVEIRKGEHGERGERRLEVFSSEKKFLLTTRRFFNGYIAQCKKCWL